MFRVATIFLLTGMLGLGAPCPLAYGHTEATTVANVALARVGDQWFLSADLHYDLSDKAKEALDNGVPLFWNVYVKILRPRPALWDETLFDTALRYRLEYHALLNVYRLVLEHNEQAYNVPSLSTALELMSSLRNLEVLGQHDPARGQPLWVAIKVEFDRSSLPMPLRPFAYFDGEWDLSSAWTLWPWKE